MANGAPFPITQSFEVISCYNCQMSFAVPAHTRQRWIENGNGFYCPAGHYQSYKEPTVRKLEKEIAKLKKQKEWAEQDARINENRRRAEKAAKTKLKNRVSKGVCPCCKRSFTNLHRHMETKHKGWAD